MTTVNEINRVSDILKSFTSGSSPTSRDEILKQLTSYNIDWHITEKGDLLIKCWRIAAEDFIPAEQVENYREGQKMDSDAVALDWVGSNLSELKIRYSGKWIAVIIDHVAVASETLPALMEELRDQGIYQAFITEIPNATIAWSTTYVYIGALNE